MCLFNLFFVHIIVQTCHCKFPAFYHTLTVFYFFMRHRTHIFAEILSCEKISRQVCLDFSGYLTTRSLSCHPYVRLTCSRRILQRSAARSRRFLPYTVPIEWHVLPAVLSHNLPPDLKFMLPYLCRGNCIQTQS